ncbi:MAG: DUF885 domain-containing protein [Acidobacteria bacterium]|nr:DUF885 domain-containing protein [Acidobacteriota bacterium]
MTRGRWLIPLAAMGLWAADYEVPDLKMVLPANPRDLREAVERFARDEEALIRFYPVAVSPARIKALGRFYSEWRRALDTAPLEGLDIHGKVDWVAFRNHLDNELRQMRFAEQRLAEMQPVLPFARHIVELWEARQRVEPMDAERAAARLVELGRDIEAMRKEIANVKVKRTVAFRAVQTIESLKTTLDRWYGFYNEYDPLFTWWAADPYRKAGKALTSYASLVREKLVGIKDDDKTTIIGDPIGREGLLSDLQAEMIPLTPEELLELANRQFAWCDREMLRASRELGFGDDWKKALEAVKQKYVKPGEQTAMVKALAIEGQEYVARHNLVTVPQLARDSWRMEMMTPEAQRVSPFFLGGEVIRVSYPTSTMTHEEKMMSMRGNNPHFSRATVFHEVIPGHHLQLFMNQRNRPYRGTFRTPFWIEGWALYWEMLLWDRGFHSKPEDRIGALFWRMHRCARIIFSLSFHLEKMTPQECVDFLVNRVGHEYENAAGEVRRSFAGNYSPLYQCAYMLGGLQFRSLHKELVGSGKMTDREFHDGVLRLNAIPVELVRATLTGQAPGRGFQTSWKQWGFE